MRRMTIAARADALAKGSGLYRLTFIDMQKRPRPIRWWSLLVLVAIVAGYAGTVTTLERPGGPVIFALAAPLVFFGAFSAAQVLRFVGPRLQPLSGGPLDERERAIGARAGHLSGLTITVAAILGCAYQGVAPLFGWWSPHMTVEWIYLGLAIEALAFVLPVFFASWMMPRLPEEDCD